MKYKIIQINKPLFTTHKDEHYLTIRTDKLERAIENKQTVRLIVPELGTYLVDPKKWIASGKVADQVFLRPDEPLRLTGNYLEKFPKEQTPIEDSVNPTAALTELAKTPEWEKLRIKFHPTL